MSTSNAKLHFSKSHIGSRASKHHVWFEILVQIWFQVDDLSQIQGQQLLCECVTVTADLVRSFSSSMIEVLQKISYSLLN